MMSRRDALLATVLLATAGCTGEPVLFPDGQSGPVTHSVTVTANGHFEPAVLTIRDGDTVEWQLAEPTDAIIPATSDSAAGCATPQPYRPGDPEDFTGPVIGAPSGLFSLGPFHRGFVVETGAAGLCADGQTAAVVVGDQHLCLGDSRYQSMASTWAHPDLTGVFIHLEWADLHLAPGSGDASFDFSALDHELDQAVRHGKRFSIGVKAGMAGTPAWIFDAGVNRLRFRDEGSDGDPTDCGFAMELGSPTDPVYRQHYFDMLRGLARHLRSRADWFRALAYVKPSGANLITAENRLPKRCAPGCLCNPAVWAAAGYTPTGLYQFYAEQLALLADELPGKELNYQLIQDGFPRVNDAGDHLQDDGTSSGGPLPDGSEQTEAIIAQGMAAHGLTFVVAHNGLRPLPAAPNRWVLDAAARGAITGFQTTNADHLSDPDQLESAIDNALLNSDAIYVEIYEQRLWEATASGRSLASRADALHQRRRDAWPQLGDPRPMVHRHTFTRTATGDQDQVLHYIHGGKCAASSTPAAGQIVIAR